MYFLPQIGWMRRLWHFGGHLPGILPWQERAGITMQRVWLRRKGLLPGRDHPQPQLKSGRLHQIVRRNFHA